VTDKVQVQYTRSQQSRPRRGLHATACGIMQRRHIPQMWGDPALQKLGLQSPLVISDCCARRTNQPVQLEILRAASLQGCTLQKDAVHNILHRTTCPHTHTHTPNLSPSVRGSPILYTCTQSTPSSCSLTYHQSQPPPPLQQPLLLQQQA
jgi:hypothetical protein